MFYILHKEGFRPQFVNLISNAIVTFNKLILNSGFKFKCRYNGLFMFMLIGFGTVMFFIENAMRLESQ